MNLRLSFLLLFSLLPCALGGCAATQHRSIDAQVKSIPVAPLDEQLARSIFGGEVRGNQPYYDAVLASQPNPNAPNGWVVARITNWQATSKPFGLGPVPGTVACIDPVARTLIGQPDSLWIHGKRTERSPEVYVNRPAPPDEYLGFNQVADAASPDGRWILVFAKPDVTEYIQPIDVPTVTVKAQLKGAMRVGLWDRTNGKFAPVVGSLRSGESAKMLDCIWSPDSRWIVINQIGKPTFWIMSIDDFDAR